MSAARVQMEFTFQYGEIKSWMVCADDDNDYDLHSSMERLKAG